LQLISFVSNIQGGADNMRMVNFNMPCVIRTEHQNRGSQHVFITDVGIMASTFNINDVKSAWEADGGISFINAMVEAQLQATFTITGGAVLAKITTGNKTLPNTTLPALPALTTPIKTEHKTITSTVVDLTGTVPVTTTQERVQETQMMDLTDGPDGKAAAEAAAAEAAAAGRNAGGSRNLRSRN